MTRAGRLIGGLLAGLLVAGCEGGLERPARPAETAIEVTTAAGSAAFRMSIATGERGVDAWVETTTGVVDFETGDLRTKSEVTFYDPPDDVPPIPPHWVVVHDGYAYLKGERATMDVPGDPEWVRLPLREVSVSPFWGWVTNPAGVLDLLSGATGGAEEQGVAEVRGEPAVHYAVELDPERMRDGAADSEQIEEAIDYFEALGHRESVPAEIWIDGEARLVRFRVASGETAESSTTTVVELYDFGAEVDVEPPPDAVPLDSVLDLIRPQPSR